MMHFKDECPVCLSTRTDKLLSRANVPVHQNSLISNQVAAANIQRGTIALKVCLECGFIYNAAFEPEKLSYDASYDNSQTFSSFFNTYVDDLVKNLVLHKGVQNCRVIEVGCGKGVFLRKLVELENSGNIGYGFDPTYVGPLIDLDGRLNFTQEFYDGEAARLSADVVICRHVIEHVPYPLELLGSIRQALANSPQTRVFFETPCVEWILRHKVFWDFFYEHCSYFTARSLTTAFERSGFKVENVEHIFGDQYLWLEATVALENNSTATTDTATVSELGTEFRVLEGELIVGWRKQLEQLAAQEGVALWGAGAKGVTVANLVDPDKTLIACVVDLNSQKQGGFVPGTGHPIISYLDLPKYQVSAAILMNPNYYEENLALLDEAGLEISLIDPADWIVK